MDRGTWWATVHRVTELGIPKATYTIRGWVVLRSQCMVHTFSQFLLNYNHHTPNTFLLTESFSGFPNVYQLSQASLATNKQQQNLQFYLPFVFFATRKKLETKLRIRRNQKIKGEHMCFSHYLVPCNYWCKCGLQLFFSISKYFLPFADKRRKYVHVWLRGGQLETVRIFLRLCAIFCSMFLVFMDDSCLNYYYYGC